MKHVLKNEQIEVTVDDHGAEVTSVKRGNCEYIWQADPTFWKGQAPLMFPICGRLFEGKYTYGGKQYEMILHGFTRHRDFSLKESGKNFLTFVLTDDAETLAQYPFRFVLEVTYTLNGDTLQTKAVIRNTGKEVLPAAFGGHPGFNIPLGGGQFEDYYLEFGEDCSPDALILSDACLCTGKKKALPLEDGRILRLHHGLFDHDAIFMNRMANRVTLKSAKSDRSVSLYYPEFPYLGIWHAPKTQAPYMCIEPWCGLPAYEGQTDDFATKNDMFRIPAGKDKTVFFEITFG